MKWTDKLTSLLLGEQGKTKNPLGLSDLQLALHRMVRHSRTPHSQKSAAGAQGDTKWAREGKPYLRRYGGGENVVHNAGSMKDLKGTSPSRKK